MLHPIKYFALLTFALLLFLHLTMTALAAPPDEPRLFRFVGEGDRYGYMDISGKVVIEPQFYFADVFVDGLAVAAPEAGQFGYINITGTWVISPQFTYAGPFSDGLAAVNIATNNPFKAAFVYMDKTGKIVIPSNKYLIGATFSEGLAQISAQGKIGFIDRNGKVVVEPQYDRADSFAEGLAAVESAGKTGYIDKTGQLVIPLKFDFGGSFSEGWAKVSLGQTESYIDKTGNIVLQPTFDSTWPFHEGLSEIRVQGKSGYMDKMGRVVISPTFVFGNHFSDGLAAVQIGNYYGYIDKTGQVVITPTFTIASGFYGGLAFVETETLRGYIDMKGHMVMQQPLPSHLRPKTTLIPFIPTLPAETVSGSCSSHSLILPESFAWQCNAGRRGISFDPCLLAGDGKTLVCGEPDPTTGQMGGALELVHPLPTTSLNGNESKIQSPFPWSMRLADDSTCIFTTYPVMAIDKRLNYFCTDLRHVLSQAKQVDDKNWTVEKGVITYTAQGFTTANSETVRIKTMWQPVDPLLTAQTIGLMPQAVTMTLGKVAQRMVGQIRPAYMIDWPKTLSNEPAHLHFTFDDHVLTKFSYDYIPELDPTQQPHLLIYPIAAYRKIYDDVGNKEISQRIDLLQTLLISRPLTISQPLPVLPDIEGVQILTSHLKYLDLPQGAGIRFITSYANGIGPFFSFNYPQKINPITNDQLFYTFQGITKDNNYYIAYFSPISTSVLPNTSKGSKIDNGVLYEQRDSYLAETQQTLDQTRDFTPTLTSLDAMLQSLYIKP